MRTLGLLLLLSLFCAVEPVAFEDFAQTETARVTRTTVAPSRSGARARHERRAPVGFRSDTRTSTPLIYSRTDKVFSLRL